MPTEDYSLLGLNRPEYVPHPGGLLSALVWLEVPETAMNGLRQKWYAFEPASDGLLNERCEYTRPTETGDRFGRLTTHLSQHVRPSQNASMAARALGDQLSLRGSNRSKSLAVAPMNVGLALMQNTRGLTNKDSPANLGKILNQLYALGGGESSMSSVFTQALLDNEENGQPAWLKDSTRMMLPDELGFVWDALREREQSPSVQEYRQPVWLNGSHSPYRWLARAWDRLCQRGWAQAMPRRRWIDWATSVARTGMASGFLFEMNLYARLIPALANDEDPDLVVRNVFEHSKTLLPWSSQKSVSARDVSIAMNKLIIVGLSFRDLLQELGDDDVVPRPSFYDRQSEGIQQWLVAARESLRSNDRNIKSDVLQALRRTNPGGLKNLKEVIRSGLFNRGGESAGDLYALMKSSGRYSWVDPAQEWLVVVSSLCSPTPETTTRLRDLYFALEDLGIQTDVKSLMRRLEEYGLARSSHDADDAAEIQTAF